MPWQPQSPTERKTEILTVRLTPSSYGRLTKFALATGHSVAGVVQSLILTLPHVPGPATADRSGTSEKFGGPSADERRPTCADRTTADSNRATAEIPGAIGVGKHPRRSDVATTRGDRGLGDTYPHRESSKSASEACGWGCPSPSQVDGSKASPKGSQAPESGSSE